MRIFTESQDLDMWNAIEEDHTCHLPLSIASERQSQNLQKRFTNLTNHLIALGKVLSNSDLNLKVLRSLTRTWQPKEHELELSQLDQHEELEKKKNNISLKAKAKKYDSSDDEDDKEETDDMSLFIKKFSKFLRRNKGRRTGK
ncbi:hypothetical protein Lal_00024467 [Lupinus albus]|nr:hypothetical protein Lal_00024467 [Lupinus albus]